MSSTIPSHPALNGEFTKLPPALPQTSVPPPKPVAQHGLLMQAITSQKSVITTAGAKVNNLVLQKTSSGDSTSPDDATSPGEFVTKGTIDLFGDKRITAEFDIWHGAPPRGVTIGSAPPSIQRAVIKGSLMLSQLIPSLSETLQGTELTFRNISIFHQNYAYDPTQSLGYNLDADLVIDSSLGSLSSLLSNVLSINDPTVHIQADLGPDLSWNGPPTIKTLTMEGKFVGKTCMATPGVHITSVCVRLVLEHGPNKLTTRDMELFGTLNLTLPGGSVLPMELDYTLKDVGGGVQLNAALPSGVTWVNPMGAQGCVLNPVTFSSSLSTSDPWKDLKLDMEAKFQYLTTTIDFRGSYAPGGSFFLDANIRNFDISSLLQLYEALHHEPLKVPSVDVTLQSANISIMSDKGLSATLTNVCIAGHVSGNATIKFSSAGSVVHADLGTVQFGDVTINSAYIQLDLQLASSSKSSDATIYGDVKFEGLEISAAVHLYPSAPGVVPKRTEWSVYAELTSSGNALALSKVVPKLKGTAFDLTLKDVLFIAASRDDPVVGADIKDGYYKPKEGVQIYATLDEIPVFNSLAKSNVTGMTLEASWSQAEGFDLDIFLPVARNLNFGKGITTTPITLSLDMTPSPFDKAVLIPSLQISAGLYIPVARSPPLLFDMILSATETDASISADLKGNWVNPFEISNEVVVGPNLLLQADLSYVTGLCGVLFKGGLTIGDTSALVVVSINEDPEKEMLYAEIENLNFGNVVAFAEKLLHRKFPAPPSDFLEFEELKLCICPAGLRVQDVTYPAGFSFQSNMIVFGKHVKVFCVINDTILLINGAVDNFQLGPLDVCGMDGAKQAVVQVQVGEDVQHLLISGAITLYADTCALHLLVNAQPSPEISFKTEFKLTELLTFEVDARLIGKLDRKDLGKADFSFHADLEQHLLDYIHDEMVHLLTRAQQAAEQGIENTKKRVSAERTDLNDKIDRAKVRLAAARETWEAYQERVTKANLAIINAYNARIATFQDAITKAEGQFNAALIKAQADLTNAQHDRQVKVQSAVEDLRKAQQKLASDFREAQNRVASAEANMNRKFGAAESDIEGAKCKVEGLQSRMYGLENTIQCLEHGPWYKMIKIAGLEIERGGVEVVIKVAEDALDAAEAILKSADYVADKAALDAAQRALELAGCAGNGLMSGCKEVLASVDKFTQAVVDRALEALNLVESGSDKIAFDGAKDAVAAYKRAADAAFHAAMQAMADLAKSAEYFAYESATTALAAAQGSTRGFDAVNVLLTEAESGTVDVLNVGKAIVDATVEALDITSVHVSGTLGKSLAGDALEAEVKGVFMKNPFAFSVDLNPSKVEDFFMSIFKQLERDVIASLRI